MRVSKVFSFDSAHFLPSYHGKCETLHGHTYRLVVTVAGVPDAEGMVIDFILLKKIVQEEVLSVLDHSLLNDILPQPTAENIAKWVWQRISEKVRRDRAALFEVEVWETPTSYVRVRSEDILESTSRGTPD
ncbi:MAG TPA: 6-carboxytetrahydropterin synthase QueD [Thermotogota bacterium]|jgi:6-pyruvoyltetrahydropterin/6-carboxytetrahydropterin synthase|nr:6-carboxytetrahydropterin synthase QueD [Thermotogota bacterium]NLH20372.1 6-carboxytetrahydropterin synthase QueD [Thermotogaceae bacterium]OQC30744.1 MAG: 6-carboxy-5,6,7,8-tetrahydropterin synthase [Thermotogota bacterium ADurb.Bin062]HNW47303.1 6-carboxytetrahydropterin synthase QueD [Thermotogota bacterium]HNY82138.1 6-carboxytetrahydropterin synthase QueD [Thermotogota bacterium]